MPDGKWVSKANLQTFWQMIRSSIASFVAKDVDDVLPTVVPEEVNKVLPTMVGEQIDNKFGDDIGDNVTSWLTEHVTPSGSAVVVDDTLTIAGAAADAKKTGDEISGLKEDLDNLVNVRNNTLYYSDFEQGYRHGRANCAKVNNATWCISPNPVLFKRGDTLQSVDSKVYAFSIVDPTPANNGAVLLATRRVDYTFTQDMTGYLEVQLRSKANVTPADLADKYYSVKYSPILDELNEFSNFRKTLITYYVNASTGSDDNSGSINEPFATIQKAINSGGNRVCVAIGTYPETVEIKDKNDFTLVPYPTPTYDSTIGIQRIEIQKLYINNCRGVRVSNFIFNNNTGWNCRINNSYDVTFDTCEAKNGIAGGFVVYDSNVIFRNCVAHDIGDANNVNSDGFNFHNSGYSELHNCIVYNTVDDGISHHERTEGLINGCTVYNCGSSVRGGGIAPTGSAKIRIENCIVHDCYRGVEAENLTEPTAVFGSVMHDNTTDCYVNNASVIMYGSKYTTVSGSENITVL